MHFLRSIVAATHRDGASGGVVRVDRARINKALLEGKGRFPENDGIFVCKIKNVLFLYPRLPYSRARVDEGECCYVVSLLVVVIYYGK